MKKLIWLAVIVVVAVGGFFLLNHRTSEVASEPVKIGAVLPLTGPAASVGEILRKGLEWKVEELKEDGRDVTLFIEDFQTDPKLAVSAFNNLVDVGGVDIVFTTVSVAGMTLKPVAEEKGILLWADISHPEFTKDTKLALRHSNLADNDAKIMARHIIEKGFKKVGIIYQVDDAGLSFNGELTTQLKKAGIGVVSEGIDNKGGDFKTEVTKIKAAGPDAVVYAVVGPAMGILVKQTGELGYAGQLYSWVGFILTPGAAEAAGDFAKGMYYQTFPDSDVFVTDYIKRFGKEPGLLADLGYTDIELLFEAIDQTGSTDPAALVAYIKSMSEFQGKYEQVEIAPTGDILIPTVIKTWE